MREPLVLLPGFMCDARVYGPQVAALSYDTPVMIAPVTQGERIEEIASAVLTAAPAKFGVAGMGLGGMVAMELLRRAPDRITRIALIDASPLAETPQDASAREGRIIRARTGRLQEVLQEDLVTAGLAVSPYRKDVLALALDMGMYLGADIYTRQSRTMMRRKDQQAVMRKCKAPALVLCGAENAILPVKRHEFLATLIPNARLEVIAGAGHMAALEQPEAVINALRAWQRQPVAAQ